MTTHNHACCSSHDRDIPDPQPNMDGFRLAYAELATKPLPTAEDIEAMVALLVRGQA